MHYAVNGVVGARAQHCGEAIHLDRSLLSINWAFAIGSPFLSCFRHHQVQKRRGQQSRQGCYIPSGHSRTHALDVVCHATLEFEGAASLYTSGSHPNPSPAVEFVPLQYFSCSISTRNCKQQYAYVSGAITDITVDCVVAWPMCRALSWKAESPQPPLPSQELDHT